MQNIKCYTIQNNAIVLLLKNYFVFVAKNSNPVSFHLQLLFYLRIYAAFNMQYASTGFACMSLYSYAIIFELIGVRYSVLGVHRVCLKIWKRYRTTSPDFLFAYTICYAILINSGFFFPLPNEATVQMLTFFSSRFIRI